MSYVERVLQPGEQLRHISSVHWIALWPGAAVALLAVAAYWFSDARYLPKVWQYAGGFGGGDKFNPKRSSAPTLLL